MGRLTGFGIVMLLAMFTLTTRATAATYSSPQEVLAAFEKAHDANDDAATLDCLSPEGITRTAQFMVGMEMATRQPDPNAPPPSADEKKAQAKIDALLAKHNIKDTAARPGEEGEAYVDRITAHMTDPRTLLLDLMKIMNGGAKQAPCRKGELQNLKITGDTATGKYVVKDPDGSSMSQNLKFKKIDNSWRLADLVMLSSTDTSEPDTTTQPAKP